MILDGTASANYPPVEALLLAGDPDPVRIAAECPGKGLPGQARLVVLVTEMRRHQFEAPVLEKNTGLFA